MKFSDRLTDQQQRNQQRQDQIIKGRVKPPIRFGTLGDRSSETGLYNVQDAAGGVKPSIKINNAQADQGGTYRITNDGVRSVADGKQGAAKEPKPRGDSLESRNVGRLLCNGYLNGQIFNCGEPEEGVPRGLIILTHSLFYIDSSSESNRSPFPYANWFAATLFDYFSNDAGAIVYWGSSDLFSPANDPLLNEKNTFISPADVPNYEDIPVGAIIYTSGFESVDTAYRDFLIDFAKNKGTVIVGMSFTAPQNVAVANDWLINLGFGGQIEARLSFSGTADDPLFCYYDPLAAYTNDTIAGFTALFNSFYSTWHWHYWADDNPIWQRYSGRFSVNMETGYQARAISQVDSLNGETLVQQPPVISGGASPTDNPTPMNFTLYVINEELEYFPLSYATGGGRIGDPLTGVTCDPSYLSGMYFTPEQLP